MILDLFAGPGGWDVGAREVGFDPLGVEIDDAACATRSKAKMRTWQGDVASFLEEGLIRSEVEGLIASPPCQTFSMAGKGAGRVALEQVLHGVKRVATGEPIPYDEYDDIRTGLVLEPLRYALELEPEWIAWEQVPTVQPVWEVCAEVLREDGYSVWTGHLHAEQYGVPQTRKRSVLIASRSRQVGRPVPTHSKFYSRNPAKLDEGVAKWVSMAEALGWRAGLYFGGRMNGAYWEMAGAGPAAEKTAGQKPRKIDEPAHCITGAATAQWTRSDTTPENRRQGSVRVTVQEAAVLQSFPPDYPWQGSKTKQYQQVGNAIPPLLALHVLSEATGIALPAVSIPHDTVADADDRTHMARVRGAGLAELHDHRPWQRSAQPRVAKEHLMRDYSTQVPTGCNVPAPRQYRSEWQKWCQRPKGHDGNHKYYRADGSAMREWS